MRMLRALLVVVLVMSSQTPALAALADDAAAYFVAPTGSNASAGTMAAPFQTIQYAVDQASASVTKKRVIVSIGTYDENVTLTNGVKLYGAFDAAAGWTRARTNATTIAPSVWSASAYPLRVQGSTDSVVDGFIIIARN